MPGRTLPDTAATRAGRAAYEDHARFYGEIMRESHTNSIEYRAALFGAAWTGGRRSEADGFTPEQVGDEAAGEYSKAFMAGLYGRYEVKEEKKPLARFRVEDGHFVEVEEGL